MVSLWALVLVVAASHRRAESLFVGPRAAATPTSFRWQGIHTVTAAATTIPGRARGSSRTVCRMAEGEEAAESSTSGISSSSSSDVVDEIIGLARLQHLANEGGAASATAEPTRRPRRSVGANTGGSSQTPVETTAAAAASNVEKNNNNSVVVSQEDDNAPIDWILSRRLPINSRRFYRKALEAGDVKVNGRVVRRFIRVKAGSKISVKMVGGSVAADTTPRNFLFPQQLPGLRVLYEDEHFVAIMKPAGMVCQPCEAAASGTVLHGLLHHMVQTKQVEEGDLGAARTLSQGIVQRLDKHTSGIMVVAKTLDSSSKFSNLFKKAKVRKEYLAICHGDPGYDSVVDAPLYRRSSGKVGAVNKSQAEKFGAKAAVTRIRNVATAAGMSLCRAEIVTGRMHQVRVHLKWKRNPIVGDQEYGDLEANYRVSKRSTYRVDARRPLLHSMTLEFTHPFTNKHMSFRAPMPDDMWAAADNILRKSGTPEQKEEFEELQASHSWHASEAATVGGRGAPRLSKKKGGRGGMGAQQAYAAVVEAGVLEG